ncbi:MAG: hypothetical protein AAB909_01150 [Patescibacteria group bacterium]
MGSLILAETILEKHVSAAEAVRAAGRELLVSLPLAVDPEDGAKWLETVTTARALGKISDIQAVNVLLEAAEVYKADALSVPGVSG